MKQAWLLNDAKNTDMSSEYEGFIKGFWQPCQTHLTK